MKAIPYTIYAHPVAKIKQNLKMTVFQKMGRESKLLNQIQWSWYHSLLRKMLYLMTSRNIKFLDRRVLKICRSAFWGDTRYKWNTNSILWICKLNIAKYYHCVLDRFVLHSDIIWPNVYEILCTYFVFIFCKKSYYFIVTSIIPVFEACNIVYFLNTLSESSIRPSCHIIYTTYRNLLIVLINRHTTFCDSRIERTCFWVQIMIDTVNLWENFDKIVTIDALISIKNWYVWTFVWKAVVSVNINPTGRTGRMH